MFLFRFFSRLSFLFFSVYVFVLFSLEFFFCLKLFFFSFLSFSFLSSLFLSSFCLVLKLFSLEFSVLLSFCLCGTFRRPIVISCLQLMPSHVPSLISFFPSFELSEKKEKNCEKPFLCVSPFIAKVSLIVLLVWKNVEN